MRSRGARRRSRWTTSRESPRQISVRLRTSSPSTGKDHAEISTVSTSTLVDDHPHVYTVAVLRQYKRDHEAQHVVPGATPTVDLVEEAMDATVLPVREMPAYVYSAKPSKRTAAETGELLPSRRGDLLPFVLRDDMLYAFHDLGHKTGPFRRCVEVDGVAKTPRWALLTTESGRSLFVWLLNNLMTRHLRRLGIGFDRARHRYFFLPDHQTVARTAETRTKTGRRIRKNVVRQEGIRTTPRDVWWHLAVRLRLEEFTDNCWGLTLRPEFHLTVDGYDPLPSHRVGRRVTRRKTRMYNDAYFEAVHFWRSFLTHGRPETILPAGQQRLTIAYEFPTSGARWPAVGGTTFSPQRVAHSDDIDVLDLAVSQLALDYDDEDWGAEFDDEDR